MSKSIGLLKVAIVIMCFIYLVRTGVNRANVIRISEAQVTSHAEFSAILNTDPSLPARRQANDTNTTSAPGPSPIILGGRIKIKRTGPWNIGTCTGTKGSGEWLREWIELQLLGGVDHIWVVDENDPDTADATPGILKYYEELGYVTIIPGKMPKKWPGCEQLAGENARNPNAEHNCIPPKYCMHHAGRHVNWLVFADSDEFLFPLNGCSLSDHVEANCDPYESHQLLRWERFGTSGHNVHPAGLMIENFLSSGADCAVLHWAPFNIAPPCRLNKVMYNTRCMGEEHAGWIHWPTNTSEWKREMYANELMGGSGLRRWVASPGNGSGLLDQRCSLNKAQNERQSCMRWLLHGGGAARPVEYNKECCSAGIGYNHYGSKSLQYFKRKAVTKEQSKRGLRSNLWQIDLNDVVSTNVLKFLRVLRERYIELGLPVSQNVNFLPSSAGSCFVENSYLYEPTSYLWNHGNTLALMNETMATTSTICCLKCLKKKSCQAFSYQSSTATCRLVYPIPYPPHADFPERYPLPHHANVHRRWVSNEDWLSGVPLREECHV
eukprot:TRINITY_DN1185_c0_g1_i10.p1 TRINITY_DN1185_c0_g1~~TRINITY_DN1185_c0_g1_i10.p1  ORF type:complete len:573 (+),score=144.52 TRINITY_DN1185_c0_g1_i10:69-1721(+)